MEHAGSEKIIQLGSATAVKYYLDRLLEKEIINIATYEKIIKGEKLSD